MNFNISIGLLVLFVTNVLTGFLPPLLDEDFFSFLDQEISQLEKVGVNQNKYGEMDTPFNKRFFHIYRTNQENSKLTPQLDIQGPNIQKRPFFNQKNATGAKSRLYQPYEKQLTNSFSPYSAASVEEQSREINPHQYQYSSEYDPSSYGNSIKQSQEMPFSELNWRPSLRRNAPVTLSRPLKPQHNFHMTHLIDSNAAPSLRGDTAVKTRKMIFRQHPYVSNYDTSPSSTAKPALKSSEMLMSDFLNQLLMVIKEGVNQVTTTNKKKQASEQIPMISSASVPY